MGEYDNCDRKDNHHEKPGKPGKGPDGHRSPSHGSKHPRPEGEGHHSPSHHGGKHPESPSHHGNRHESPSHHGGRHESPSEEWGYDWNETDAMHEMVNGMYGMMDNEWNNQMAG